MNKIFHKRVILKECQIRKMLSLILYPLNENWYYHNEIEGKGIALDYQMFGKGIVAGEIYYMHYISWAIYNFDGIEENIKEYHDALVANGVTNYNLSGLLDDFVMSGVGQLFALLNFMVMSKPETFINQFKGIFGEEKAEGMMKLISLGLFNKCFLILTSLYVRDKENFLLVKS